MRECRRPPNNCPSREELPKLAFPVVPGFLEPEGMKTPLIIALYAIPSRPPVSEYPPLKRLFGRFLRKWPHRQIEGAVSMSLEKGNTSSCLSGEHTVAAKSPEADRYVHNSPLRFELATHHSLYYRTKERRKTQLIVISMWVTHKQSPADLSLRNPPGVCVWITLRKGDRNRRKGAEYGNLPLTQSCHSAITAKEGIGWASKG